MGQVTSKVKSKRATASEEMLDAFEKDTTTDIAKLTSAKPLFNYRDYIEEITEILDEFVHPDVASVILQFVPRARVVEEGAADEAVFWINVGLCSPYPFAAGRLATMFCEASPLCSCGGELVAPAELESAKCSHCHTQGRKLGELWQCPRTGVSNHEDDYTLCQTCLKSKQSEMAKVQSSIYVEEDEDFWSIRGRTGAVYFMGYIASRRVCLAFTDQLCRIRLRCASPRHRFFKRTLPIAVVHLPLSATVADLRRQLSSGFIGCKMKFVLAVSEAPISLKRRREFEQELELIRTGAIKGCLLSNSTLFECSLASPASVETALLDIIGYHLSSDEAMRSEATEVIDMKKTTKY